VTLAKASIDLLRSEPCAELCGVGVATVRSACYKQLSNFEGVISDCTCVLEVKVSQVHHSPAPPPHQQSDHAPRRPIFVFASCQAID
jgi:hypothetical protein